MRGKVVPLGVVTVLSRITPAYAGKRHRWNCRRKRTEDHPRLCGEKARQVLKLDKEEGSPPPMRGKVLSYAVQRLAGRITPAYAGKRHGARPKYHGKGDHPRLCGEK